MHFLFKLSQQRDVWLTGDTYVRLLHLQVRGAWFAGLEWAITVLAIVAFLLWQRPRLHLIGNRLNRFAANHARACLLVFCLSIAGRMALLSIERFPEPAIHDEFSYLLGGDTLAHGRLANPELPSWHHFEPFHVLMEPTYSSMYPPGFPMFLALGERLFGTPRAGLLICAAAAAASLCWMLQILVPPGWALMGGLLAVIRMNWFSYFGNSYWGGSAGMLAGCLVAGAAMRLVRKPEARVRDAVILSLGLFLLLNTRPYEGAAFSIPLVAWVLWTFYRRRETRFRASQLRALAAGTLVFLAGAAWTGFYCYRVTGRLMFPQALQRQQWAMTPLVLGAKPNYEKTYQFQDQYGLYRDYELQELFLPQNSLGGYLRRKPKYLFLNWHFFISPALTILLIGFIPMARSRRDRPAAVAFLCLCLALAAELIVQAQYTAVGAGVIYLALVNGMRWLRCLGRKSHAALALLNGTFAAVILAVVARLFIVPTDSWPPSWCSWQREMSGYGGVVEYTEHMPGRQLIFVHYDRLHPWPATWINNGADVASEKVIWARDTEPLESDLPLICSYPGREVLLLTPPDGGYTALPTAEAHVNVPVEQFLKAYPIPTGLTCSKSKQVAAR